MIWQVARVIARDADRLDVAFQAPESCQRCARGQGCGAGALSRLFGARTTCVTVPASVAAACGQWVRVGFRPGQLALAASLHYGLPLLGFLGGALAVHHVLPAAAFRDAVALAGGLAGFMLATQAARRVARPLRPIVEPVSCAQGGSGSGISSFD